ncbi:MAG: hypothetical protein NC397_00100 [Clostridium sp.]|nr:hypothetical protein [Clostridium sp.]
MKDDKLLKTDTKIDLWAFVKVTKTSETNNVLSVSNQSKHDSGALVSASFGFVLRSPNGDETKPLG